MTPAEKFYSANKFVYLPVDENDVNFETTNKHNKLSYCKSCALLRPPRSFHCKTCGVCIEMHDHHCPWVGTCVGHRNIRFFIGFLFSTAFHGFNTMCISMTAKLSSPNPLKMISKDQDN